MKQITYTPSAGTHIEKACAEAIRIAKANSCVVRFSFNDVEITANQESTPDSLLQFWHDETERRRVAYRNSDAGRAAANRMAAEASRCSTMAESLLFSLSSILLSEQEHMLMKWLKEFAAVADNVSVRFDTFRLAAKFEAIGYKENYGVGNPPEWFNTRYRMASYIVGQVINCLKLGMPPHPMTCSFVDKYFALEP